MKFKEFIKEKLLTIFLLIFAIITIEIFLMVYTTGRFIKIYIPIVILLIYFIGILYEYIKKKRYYNYLNNIMQELNEKYLITSMIKTPDFLEGRILKNILEDLDKSMKENVNTYKYLMEDYKEYIELWIHEIKTPIATSKMIIENNKNEVTRSINEELDEIENYTEQALFYARSNTIEKDYYIRKCELIEIVNESIKKNKNILIQQKVEINLHDLDLEVNTDKKWIIFIVNQIIQNSIKYRKKDNDLKLEIYGEKGKENRSLIIKDNGIGIREEEILKVFEKGFTGYNGRLLGKKSTGIGLYLCNKLCDKLGIKIVLTSKLDKGTEVKLIFPRGSYINL